MPAPLSPVYPSGFSTRGQMTDAEVVEAMRNPHYRIGWLERTLKEALKSLHAINDSRANLEAEYRIRDVEHTLRLSNAANLFDPDGKPPASVIRETWRWAFTNETAAEGYLAERGFSVGRRQGGSERGILYGDFDIQKWRNLSSADRAALHGVLRRTGRDMPATVTIFAAAPVEAHEAIRTLEPGAQKAKAPASPWQPIETAPTKEDVPFLVLTPGNDVARFLILQVTRFQGALYPDHKDGAIDHADAVTTATHWMPAVEPADASEKVLPVAAAAVTA